MRILIEKPPALLLKSKWAWFDNFSSFQIQETRCCCCYHRWRTIFVWNGWIDNFFPSPQFFLPNHVCCAQNLNTLELGNPYARYAYYIEIRDIITSSQNFSWLENQLTITNFTSMCFQLGKIPRTKKRVFLLIRWFCFLKKVF